MVAAVCAPSVSSHNGYFVVRVCHRPKSEVEEEGTGEALCCPGCCDLAARTRAVCGEHCLRVFGAHSQHCWGSMTPELAHLR